MLQPNKKMWKACCFCCNQLHQPPPSKLLFLIKKLRFIHLYCFSFSFFFHFFSSFLTHSVCVYFSFCLSILCTYFPFFYSSLSFPLLLSLIDGEDEISWEYNKNYFYLIFCFLIFSAKKYAYSSNLNGCSADCHD